MYCFPIGKPTFLRFFPTPELGWRSRETTMPGHILVEPVTLRLSNTPHKLVWYALKAHHTSLCGMLRKHTTQACVVCFRSRPHKLVWSAFEAYQACLCGMRSKRASEEKVCLSSLRSQAAQGLVSTGVGDRPGRLHGAASCAKYGMEVVCNVRV